MELVQSVVSSLQQEDFLALVHIKYAYLHIIIFPPHQRFLLFTVEGHYFQFVALLFGLSMAPGVFTKVLALVLGLLHSQCIPIRGYLNGLLLKAQSILLFNQMCPTQCKLWKVLDGFWIY